MYRAQLIFGRWWIVLGTERIIEVPQPPGAKLPLREIAREMANELNKRERVVE